MKFTGDCWDNIGKLKSTLASADAVLIGAGAGLSAAAGLTYEGSRFFKYFADFHEKYGITNMYAGGFYPFGSRQEFWAWWSRQIWYNRYDVPATECYRQLRRLVEGREYFVLTTNVDHQFQLAGFDKNRLFYMQGDYGLFQCSVPCQDLTYDNRESVRRMVKEQREMSIPLELLPRCPRCGGPMTINLRCDDTFVQDQGWYAASRRYAEFLRQFDGKRLLLLELGVGANTPGIIKYPFWQMALRNRRATYICVNRGEAYCPTEIADRSVCLNCDINYLLSQLSVEQKA